MSTGGQWAVGGERDLVLDGAAIAAAVLAAFRHAPTGVALVDASGRIVDGNAAFAARAQVRPADLRGMSIAEVAERVSGAIEQSPVDGAPTLTLAVVGASGDDDAGAVRGVVLQRDELFAVLAHELRNPLAPIRTGLEILSRAEALPAQSKRAREIMTRQLGHLIRLVDEMLDLSRIGRGVFRLERRPMRLVTALEHGLEASRPAVDAAGHTLALRLAPEPMWVDGDLTRLTQVVANLVNNAAKFTPRSGRIEVSLRREQEPLVPGSEPGEFAVIEVSDSGIGWSSETTPKLFQLFGQGSDGPALGGMGIGLALARGLVELHGGRVSGVSRGQGLGSTFAVHLPLASPPPDSNTGPIRVAPPALRALDVLVIDDNEDSADAVASLFEVAGHRVRVAYDGPTGLVLAREVPPEVVFCDVDMPGMSGHQVAIKLRAELADALLVALTGLASETDQHQSREAGFDLHLTKPVDPLALEQVLWSRMAKE